jgi:hypothetical protein
LAVKKPKKNERNVTGCFEETRKGTVEKTDMGIAIGK